MDITLVAASTSTASLVLRYSAAFFFVLVAIFLAYTLFKAAKTLERLDKVLADVDESGIPLMHKAGETLDGVNANLTNVDEITRDVAGITDKIDTMANAVEGAVSTPARKAAAFSAGVQSAVSSFMRRDKPAETADWSAGGSAASGAAPAGGWSFAAAEAAPAASPGAGSGPSGAPAGTSAAAPPSAGASAAAAAPAQGSADTASAAPGTATAAEPPADAAPADSEG